MRILFVVTARGGSKGVPNKNIIDLGGLPLLAYKIIAAQRCGFDHRIIVSTDSEKIAAIATEYGADVPFMRPDYLATDTASSVDVISHALEWVEKNDDRAYDYVCMLEPSSPFLSYKDIDNCFNILLSSDADTLLGMRETEVAKVFIHTLDDNGGLSLFYEAIKDMKSIRRQDQAPEYTMNGCIYVAKTQYFKDHKLFHSINSVPYIMPGEKSIEIDTMDDYRYAQYLIKENLVDLQDWK